MGQNRSRRRKRPAARRQPANSRDKRPPRGYRLSERTIRRWTRGLLYALLIGFAVGIVLALLGLILRNDDLPPFGLGVAALWTLVVLLTAAIVGGQTLGRFGGLVGVALIVGMVLGLAGGLIAPWVQWLGYGLAALAVIGFFIMGIRRRVPIWIGYRSNGG